METPHTTVISAALQPATQFYFFVQRAIPAIAASPCLAPRNTIEYYRYGQITASRQQNFWRLANRLVVTCLLRCRGSRYRYIDRIAVDGAPRLFCHNAIFDCLGNTPPPRLISIPIARSAPIPSTHPINSELAIRVLPARSIRYSKFNEETRAAYNMQFR
jgi:hypothetical protein